LAATACRPQAAIIVASLATGLVIARIVTDRGWALAGTGRQVLVLRTAVLVP
jgi:hypothetical protein